MLSVNDLISPLFTLWLSPRCEQTWLVFFQSLNHIFFVGWGWPFFLTVDPWILKYQETSWAQPLHWRPVSKTSVDNSAASERLFWMSISEGLLTAVMAKTTTPMIPWYITVCNCFNRNKLQLLEIFLNLSKTMRHLLRHKDHLIWICWLEVKGQGHFFPFWLFTC